MASISKVLGDQRTSLLRLVGGGFGYKVAPTLITLLINVSYYEINIPSYIIGNLTKQLNYIMHMINRS